MSQTINVRIFINPFELILQISKLILFQITALLNVTEKQILMFARHKKYRITKYEILFVEP